VGHIGLAYLLGKTSARTLKTRLNVPLVLVLSVLPDVDIALERLQVPFVEHRHITHSVIVTLIAFVPFFLVYRKAAVPYFLALIQHALIGDYLTGQVWLLWPFGQSFSLGIGITSPLNIGLEWSVFVLSLLIMLKTEDMRDFFRPRKWNLALAIPTFTVLLPTFLSVPLEVPVWLIPPHVILTILFSASVLVEVWHLLRRGCG
jgi:membrane-bound metal-dependent hydrolase YbcI (DUF457 family)